MDQFVIDVITPVDSHDYDPQLKQIANGVIEEAQAPLLAALTM